MPNTFRENDYNNFSADLSAPPPLGKKHKIAAGALVVFGVFIFIAWIVQMKNNIYGPFVYKSNNKNQSNISLTENNSEEVLKTKDSDKDGLSDWDELYLYHTSPYLEDSDSDGFTDKQEVDSNTDPNCPVGRDCGSLGIINGDQKVVNQGEAKNNNSLNSLLDQFNSSQSEQSLATTSKNEQIDVATLRQLLSENGMQKDILDKISDKELIESYIETLSNSQ